MEATISLDVDSSGFQSSTAWGCWTCNINQWFTPPFISSTVVVRHLPHGNRQQPIKNVHMQHKALMSLPFRKVVSRKQKVKTALHASCGHLYPQNVLEPTNMMQEFLCLFFVSFLLVVLTWDSGEEKKKKNFEMFQVKAIAVFSHLRQSSMSRHK